MNSSCVQTRCTKCGAESYRSAGVFARATGKPLTGHTAVLVPVTLGCLDCGSDQVDVFNPNSKTVIVRAGKTPHCRICNNYIPEKFIETFPLADFCPLCVKEGLVSDANVVAAYGDLLPKYGSSVVGEAYRFMSMEFRWQGSDEVSQMKWLRKAVNEGDVFACQTLGDILSRSNDPVDLADAAMAYEKAVNGFGSKDGEGYAERRLAGILFQGKGCNANSERAVELMLAAAAKGNSTAISDLGKLYFNGACGLIRDEDRAFDCYQKAFELCPKSMSDSAAVALMVLEGVGTKVDENKGSEILQRAISIYGENKSDFNQEACLREVMAARQLKEGRVADLPAARIYLDWMAKLTVPVAASLLARCGGSLPPFKPRWELSLWKVLPDNKIDLWSVQSPEGDRSSYLKTIGQVERLQNRQWIATTDDGVPVGETFNTRKDAVDALALALECKVPYPLS